MRQWLFLVLMVCALAADGATQVPPAPQRMMGVRLETIAWPAAEQHLKADAVVVLPLGARSSAHGPHLPLGTKGRLAEYLTRRVLEHANVIVAPPFSYHYSPSVVEYPGSTSLTRNTARDLTVDVVRSLVRHGPRRFYVL